MTSRIFSLLFLPSLLLSPASPSRMSLGSNYWESYQKISSKLKKRFMRKPNFNEGAEDFEELMKSLNRQGNHSYAAFCCLAVARCDQALQNLGAEASSYVEAARLFWESETESQGYQFSLDGSNFGFEEYLIEAINCYHLAIECYTKLSQKLMCAQLYIELGNILKLLKKFTEAIVYYGCSVDILLEHSLGIILPLHSLHSIVCCQIEIRDYTGALDTLTQGINVASKERAKKQDIFGNSSSDHLRQTILDYEIDRILVMLLEQFDYSQILAEFDRVSALPVTSPDPKGDSNFSLKRVPQVTETVVNLDSDTSMLLKSVMVAFKAGDLKALAHLENMLWLDAPPLQRELFHLLVASKAR